MKTPDEIKKGLGCDNCKSCPYSAYNNNDGDDHCGEVEIDALAYIRQLETQNTELLTNVKQLERERVAAVADIPRACGYCKWFEINRGGNMTECHNTNGCRNISGVNTGFEWRGVKEE